MGKQLTKEEFLSQISARTGMSRYDAKSVYHAFMEIIGEQLESGNPVQVYNFGTFKPFHRKARQGRNPQTGEAVQIAAKNTVRFSPAKPLIDALNK